MSIKYGFLFYDIKKLDLFHSINNPCLLSGYYCEKLDLRRAKKVSSNVNA